MPPNRTIPWANIVSVKRFEPDRAKLPKQSGRPWPLSKETLSHYIMERSWRKSAMSTIARGIKELARDTPGVREAVLFALSLNRFRRSPKQGELRTLCYHRVPPNSVPGLSRQLKGLRDYGEIIRPDEALSLLSGGSFDGRYFLVTFDDGYECTVSNALPVLLDHNIKALMFVISDYLINPPHEGFLTKEGCREWLRAGMAIGSHTNTHRQLSTLSEQEVIEELNLSQIALSKLSGAPIQHFASPWGLPNRDFYRDRDPPLAKAAGYSTFFTTTRGPARRCADPMCLPRDVIEPDWGVWQFRYFFGESF
jgi:peptidoglycan/xylan/chitin deacetylase (PgdA/CDA1 family)